MTPAGWKISWEQLSVCFCFLRWVPSCFNARLKYMTSYRENTHWEPCLGCLPGQCVMLREMMDGFQTKSKFEERAAERLRAHDGWIGQLHRLATANSAHNTSYNQHHPQKNQEKKKKLGNKSLHTHLRQKITSRGRFKIHKLLVLYTGCLLYSNKRENLISVRRAATKEPSESFKAEL